MSGWGNPVVGGIALRKTAIQSPNYTPGTDGWTINEDGTAEFGGLITRGTFQGENFLIDDQGIFFYSGGI